MPTLSETMKRVVLTTTMFAVCSNAMFGGDTKKQCQGCYNESKFRQGGIYHKNGRHNQWYCKDCWNNCYENMQWIVGSSVEVFNSKYKVWCQGDVVEIYYDKGREWLSVCYDEIRLNGKWCLATFLRVEGTPEESRGSYSWVFELTPDGNEYRVAEADTRSSFLEVNRCDKKQVRPFKTNNGSDQDVSEHAILLEQHNRLLKGGAGAGAGETKKSEQSPKDKFFEHDHLFDRAFLTVTQTAEQVETQEKETKERLLMQFLNKKLDEKRVQRRLIKELRSARKASQASCEEAEIKLMKQGERFVELLERNLVENKAFVKVTEINNYGDYTTTVASTTNVNVANVKEGATVSVDVRNIGKKQHGVVNH